MEINAVVIDQRHERIISYQKTLEMNATDGINGIQFIVQFSYIYDYQLIV